MTNWDEGAGRVSRAFDDWRLVEGDQRAFLALGQHFAEGGYQQLWEEAESEAADPESAEQIDLFEKKVEGLHEHEYVWMLCCAVLRDAVSNFEVYLEKAQEEVLRHQGKRVETAEHSPRWGDLREFYDRIGATIETVDVEAVRRLRHFLVHRRGELRTTEQRVEFAPHAEGIGPLNAEVTPQGVVAAMDALGVAVRKVDACVYRCSWGGELLS